MNNKILIGALLVLFVVTAGAVWYVWASLDDDVEEQARQSRETVRLVATEFGTRLGDVELDVPTQEAAENIRGAYADLIAPELLLAWQDDPSLAPGRRSASSIPNGIEIIEIVPLEADAFEVRAREVRALSTGETTDTRNVRIIVERRGGLWLIASYTSVEDFAPPELDPTLEG